LTLKRTGVAVKAPLLHLWIQAPSPALLSLEITFLGWINSSLQKSEALNLNPRTAKKKKKPQKKPSLGFFRMVLVKGQRG
jgi:hypothetical protein